VLYLIFSDSTNFFPAVYFETIFFREKMFGDCMNLTGIIAPRRADLQGGLLLYLGWACTWIGLIVEIRYCGGLNVTVVVGPCFPSVQAEVNDGWRAV
jgi:hypothetical protein